MAAGGTEATPQKGSMATESPYAAFRRKYRRRSPLEKLTGWFLQCCTPYNLAIAIAYYFAFVILSYVFFNFSPKCEKLRCDEPIKGFLYNHGKGHLLVQEIRTGTDAADRCSALCIETPDCAHWQYELTFHRKGICTLWAVDQDVCDAEHGWSLLRNHSLWYVHSRLGKHRYVTGGNCRKRAAKVRSRLGGAGGGVVRGGGEEKVVNREERVPTTECPKLQCGAVTKGFLFDHPHLGHMAVTKTNKGPRRPHSCFLKCRQTHGCAFWMYDMGSVEGYCKMWSKKQDPCDPTDPFDSSTAQYTRKHPSGNYVIGGHCDKLPLLKVRKRGSKGKGFFG